MKNSFLTYLAITVSATACYSPTPVPINQQPVVVQQPIQDQVPNYEIRTDLSGNQVVYYTDPYSNQSLFVDMILWNSLISRPGGYYNIHSYYVSNPLYFRNSYTTYNRTYTRSTYRSASDGGARFRSSIPNRPSSSSPRSSIPTGRTNSSSPSRSSIPSGRSSYTPSRSSSTGSSRSSMPSGRRR